MDVIKRIVQSEPVMVVAFIGAVVNVLFLFGVPIDEAQKSGVLIVFDLGLAMFARHMVTPVTKVTAQVDAEVTAQVDAAVEDALTAEAEPATPEQQQLVDDLRSIIDGLHREREMGIRS